MSGVDDRFRTLPIGDNAGLMACCPRDGEPLVSTLEFRDAEFVCMVCDTQYGFLAPVGKPATPGLDARHAEHKAAYEVERDARREANRQPGDPPYEPDYVWPPVTSVDDHRRRELRPIPHGARPFIDGHWVGTDAYDRFGAEWMAFYDANKSDAS